MPRILSQRLSFSVVCAHLLVVGCGKSGPTTITSKQPSSGVPRVIADLPSRPPEEYAGPFSAEVVEAWGGAGAAPGWMAPEVFGSPQFRGSATRLEHELPALLVYEDVTEKSIADLPQPQTPFGLHLGASWGIDEAKLHEIAAWENLRYLSLYQNQVTKEGLRQLAAAKGLEWLDLSEAGFNDDDAGGVAEIIQLRRLTACINNLTRLGLAEISGLNNLEALDVSYADISDSDLIELAPLAKLKFLDVSNTRVQGSGLAPLAKTMQLETLRIAGLGPKEGVRDEGLRAITKHQSLRSLGLQGAKLTSEALGNLSTLTKLNKLDLSYNNPLTPSDAAHIAAIAGLEELNLVGTPIDDEGVRHLASLKSLQKLYLDSTQVTDVAMAYVAQMKELRTLDLNCPALTNEGIARLAKLQHLEELEIWEAQITDEGVAALAPLTNLRSLQLYKVPVTDAGLEVLKGMTQLKRLSLSHTQVTDGGLDAVIRLKSLKWLDLGGTAITDAGLATLTALPNLQFLYVGDTKVTDEAFWALREKWPACDIDH